MATSDVEIFNESADEPGGSPTAAQLAGAQVSAQASAVSAQQQSNPIDVSVTGAEMVAGAGNVVAGLPGSWPLTGANWQAGVNVSDWPNSYGQGTAAFDHQKKKDLVITNGRYPSSQMVTDHFSDLTAHLAFNSGHRNTEHELIANTRNDGSQHKMKDKVINSNSATNLWYAEDSATGGSVHTNNARFQLSNPNFEGTDPGTQDLDLAVGYWREQQRLGGTGSTPDYYNLLHGKFYDSMDFQDSKPTRTLSDGVTSANVDYLRPKSSGSTNPSFYRDGIKYCVAKQRDSFGDASIAISNGGRDNNAVNQVTSNNQWAGFWDARLVENVQGKLDLERKATSNALEFITSDTDARMDILIRSALISLTMVDQTAANRLGKGCAILDFGMSWTISQSPFERYPTNAQIPNGHWEAARFIMGLAALHDGFIGAPGLNNSTYVFPYMDECVYDTGEPVGGTPSIGTIDETTTAYTLTRRADDDNGFLWQEYDNLIWVSNLNPPAGNADYPQAPTDVCILPDPGVGKFWYFADSNYTNTARTTGPTQADNQQSSVNTGGLVGSTLTIPRWHSRMLIRGT